MVSVTVPAHPPHTAAREPLIRGRGTPEAVWQAWNGLRELPWQDIAGLVAGRTRAVMIAPHPDDEVLSCGGMVRHFFQAGVPVMVVAVTDGEASHAPTPARSAWELAQQRRREAAQGWSQLGLAPQAVLLGMPDGHANRHEEALRAMLEELLQPGDAVFCPWRHDGHPDHEATGRAAASAAEAVGCRLHETPIWMWHWAGPHDPRVPWSRLRRVAIGSDGLAAKRAAIAAHLTQIRRGPSGEDPVLPGWALDRWLRREEFVFVR